MPALVHLQTELNRIFSFTKLLLFLLIYGNKKVKYSSGSTKTTPKNLENTTKRLVIN